MSFVRDDSSRSRGVGAIASVDMASPRRRIAAAREARALAQRDALMARSTLGRVARFTSPATGTYGARSIEVGGGLKKPSGPSGGGAGRTPGKPSPGKVPPAIVQIGRTSKVPPGKVAQGPDAWAADDRKGVVMVKSPGSVIAPPTEPAKIAVVPAKAQAAAVNVTAGGGWSAGVATPSAAPIVPPVDISDEPLPELPDEGFVEPTLPATQPKAPSNVLLYAALGIGALWLLTRE